MSTRSVNFSRLNGVRTNDRLRVRFTHSGIDDINYVLVMASSGIIVLGDRERRIISTAWANDFWSSEKDRTMTFKVGPMWHREFFEKRMLTVIESISVVA